MEVELTNLLDQECNISDLAEEGHGEGPGEGLEEGIHHQEDSSVLEALVAQHTVGSCAEVDGPWMILGGLRNLVEP